MKNITIFHLKNTIFTAVNNHGIVSRRGKLFFPKECVGYEDRLQEAACEEDTLLTELPPTL